MERFYGKARKVQMRPPRNEKVEKCGQKNTKSRKAAPCEKSRKTRKVEKSKSRKVENSKSRKVEKREK